MAISEVAHAEMKKCHFASPPSNRDLRIQAEVHVAVRSEEHTSELQSQSNIVCRLLLEKKKIREIVRSKNAFPQIRPPAKKVCRKSRSRHGPPTASRRRQTRRARLPRLSPAAGPGPDPA